jgi:hypothetical protein
MTDGDEEARDALRMRSLINVSLEGDGKLMANVKSGSIVQQ